MSPEHDNDTVPPVKCYLRFRRPLVAEPGQWRSECRIERGLK